MSRMTVVNVAQEVSLSEDEITLIRRLVISSTIQGAAVLIAESLLSKLPWPMQRPQEGTNGRADPTPE